MSETPDLLDLLVVGAGPTGLAIGAAARQAGLRVLVVDRGPVVAAIQGYPTDLEFFTTRDRLEIAGVPFAIPAAKPTRRQAIVYYAAVAAHHGLPLALYEAVESIARRADGTFAVASRKVQGGETFARRARAVAVATGYFGRVKRLEVPGEDLPWVTHRYLEPYPYIGRHIAVVGGGNSAVEAALDLWRNGARVTLIHRRAELKRGVKYWLRPDIENRFEEGSIAPRLGDRVTAFRPGFLDLETAAGERESLAVDAALVLIGYLPESELLAAAGVAIDPETLVPDCDLSTCETNVPSLFVAGTLQAGRATDRIFIENSRDHGERIVRRLLATWSAAAD